MVNLHVSAISHKDFAFKKIKNIYSDKRTNLIQNRPLKSDV
jgi:hypothetical protein